MRGHVAVLAAATLVAAALVLSGSGAAQDVPTPDANDLGVSQNDVRDEPNHPDDENGFVDTDPFFSPAEDTLVLEGYTENGPIEEDYSNLVNVALHGESTGDYEQYMFPGLVSYEAYWGWWSDDGGGGDLQEDETTSQLSFVGPANGAIDDADDCGDTAWDEFVWRGPNAECAADHGYSEHDDEMYAFIEPGTHDIQVLSIGLGITNPRPVGVWIASEHDGPRQADFAYGNAGDGQGWEAAFGWSRIMYDSSLLISTQVTTSVNPTSDPADDTAYFPRDSTAHDIDVYSNLHPAVEDAYRMTVWDPPQDYGDEEDEENLVSERGLKGILKGPVAEEYRSTKQEARDTADEQSPTAVTGFARSLAQGPRFHEPTTAQDQYGFGTDGSAADWATFDPATSYGGLDDDDNDGEQEFYEPGPGQTYTGYQAGERFWADSLVSVNLEPNWVGLIGIPEGRHVTPELPDTDDPAGSLHEEDDDKTTAPGFVYLSGHIGTWYDANGDTFVGEASEEPYQRGMKYEPHDYYNNSEFQGLPLGKVDAVSTFTPLNDTDGDGVNDWGPAGVYKLDYLSGNPYADAYMDVVGDAVQPVGDAARDNVPLADFVVPDDEEGRLSRHHTEGEITFDSWYWNENEQPAGEWHTSEMLYFPAGSANIWFKTETQFTLSGERLGEHGDTKGLSLQGQSVKDVDIVRSIESTSE